MLTPSSPPFHFCEGLQNGHLSVKSQCIETPPTDYSAGGSTNAWCSLFEGGGSPLSSPLWALSQLMQCRWKCNCKHKVEWNILLLCVLEKPISDFFNEERPWLQSSVILYFVHLLYLLLPSGFTNSRSEIWQSEYCKRFSCGTNDMWVLLGWDCGESIKLHYACVITVKLCTERKAAPLSCLVCHGIFIDSFSISDKMDLI